MQQLPLPAGSPPLLSGSAGGERAAPVRHLRSASARSARIDRYCGAPSSVLTSKQGQRDRGELGSHQRSGVPWQTPRQWCPLSHQPASGSRAAMLSALARAGGLALARGAGPSAACWLAPAVVSVRISPAGRQCARNPGHPPFQRRRRRRLRAAANPQVLPAFCPAAGGPWLCHTDRAEPDVLGARRARKGAQQFV